MSPMTKKGSWVGRGIQASDVGPVSNMEKKGSSKPDSGKMQLKKHKNRKLLESKIGIF